MMAGQLVLFAMNSHLGMYLGLFLLIIGNGFFKPNISTLVGGLYKEGDDRRDSAFSIFYMGINLGAFLAPLVIGILTDGIFATKSETGEIVSYGYRYGFLAAAIGMFLGQILFNLLAEKYLGDLGKRPNAVSSSDLDEFNPKDIEKPLTHEEKQRINVIFIFFLFAIFFWAGFEQAGSSLSLYTDKYIDREFMGSIIPTSWFQSVNPLFIVLLAPLFSIFWNTKYGKKLTSPVKLGLGMVILGIGFFFMLGAVAERGGDVQDQAVKASLMWLIMTYLIHTIGELFLSPVGLSVVTKLSPPKLASVLMGVWLLSSFVANILGGFLASSVESLGAGKIFLYVSIFVIACGILLIALNKKLMKMMHGVR
jgi:POT family proton-dependent oligopeptide transporter